MVAPSSPPPILTSAASAAALLLSLLLLLIISSTSLVSAIPVDNGVEGEPEIECGPTSVTINFNTRNPFEGHVYVKGLFDQGGCRSDEHGRQVAGIELPFDTCNVARTRSLNPKGVFVSTTVVISFHPQFVTKVDRAYRIQCFYMEADKTVSSQLEVSEITTQFQTQVVPMPVCRYEILEGGPHGQPVQFATIGQQVYHKWTCDSETVDTFCAVVHSCVVDDGNGDTVQILNEEGCALDKFLLNNLEYPTDLSAGQEAHVYKYADRAQLFYQCQISITIKEPHADCPRPKCAEPTGFNAVKLSGNIGGSATTTHTNASGTTATHPAAASAGGAAAAASAGPAANAQPPPAAAVGGAGPSAQAPPPVGQPPSGASIPGSAAAPATGRPPPPAAPSAGGRRPSAALSQLRLLRRRRAAAGENILDVRAELNALDISQNLPDSLSSRLSSANHRRHFLFTALQEGICMSIFGFSMFIGLSGLLLASTVAVLFYAFWANGAGGNAAADSLFWLRRTKA
ncbi:hypothetical protein niasHT_020682 [Heterodera trifolii]|uniref:ZP domain-containing protein n=1 Tax=Heterodera trifolii TaxID=157864 RepID=A0ABD2KNJ4_9BILA